MKKTIFTHALVFLAVFVPVIAFAQLFDPSKGLVGGVCEDGQCTFENITDLVRRIMNFIFYMSVPVAALLFAYAGFLFATAGPNASQAQKAKTIFTNVAVGFGIILAAWLIVYTVAGSIIEDGFFDPEFTPLGN